MPLKPLPFREVKRRLEAAGFAEVSIKGSHVKFAKSTDEGTWVVIVPHHTEVSIGTLRSILRQANLSIEDFAALAKR
jgi:predicted RNA binding protein YcfA (HicA-like mRNA interferase family)